MLKYLIPILLFIFSSHGYAQKHKNLISQNTVFDQAYFFNTPGTIRGEELLPSLMPEMIALINQASFKIDICVYDFNYQPLIDAIIQAKNRGVQIRFVGDGDNVNTAGYVAMQNNQVPTTLRPASSNIMHNKFMVIDDQILIAGSMNYSDTDVMRNNNHTLFIRDALLASQYTAEFNQMFNATFGTRKIQAVNNMEIQTPKATIRAYFGPKDDLLNAVLRNLQGTPKRVYFMIFSFTHPQIAARLIELKALGTEIIGIFDEGQASNQYSQDEALALVGIPVAFDGNENNIGFAGGKLHHKSMIIEYETEKIVLAGSYNWSKAATQANDENLIQLKGIDPFKSFTKEFCRRWDEAILHPQSTPYQQEPPLCVEIRTPPLVKVQIQTIMADPIGKDLGQEYVVIKNVGNVAVDLSNWKLGDLQTENRHVFSPGSFLNVNATLKIYDRGVYADGIVSSSATLSLNNTGDVIRLFTSQNTEMDRWEYLESDVREGVEIQR